MSFISDLMDRIRPVEVYPVEPDSTSKLVGSADPLSISYGFFSKMNEVVRNYDRSKFLASIKDMTTDFAIADKALGRLCEDATCKPISVDAPGRRKRIIEDMIKQIGYEEHRMSWIYGMLSQGDLFLQKEYVKSVQPGRMAFISRVLKMPTETMIRNTDDRDEFYNPNEAFYQVNDISNMSSTIKTPFSIGKIQHARNDWERSEYFRYGRSIWHSAVRVFNMAVMTLEDSAIQRHQSTQNVLWHFVGRHSETRPGETVINEYARRVKNSYTESTNQMFVDGSTQVEQIGGTKNIIGTVDDIRLILSILAIALDYPLDLLSVGLTGQSGGEELFRKEVVLKRTVESIIKREINYILKPLIDTELHLAGQTGKYNLIAFPASFEDANKRATRGILEVQAGLKSFQTYHEENNPEISFEEEQKRIKKWQAFKKEFEVEPEPTEASPSAGERGATADKEDQQQRLTPGSLGTDNRSD